MVNTETVMLKSSAMALMLLSTVIALMLAGMATANENCIQETGIFFGKCMEEAYLIAGIPPTKDHKKGDDALSELINNEKTVVDGCKGKWQVAACVITNLCSAKECTYKDAEIFEDQFKKELMPFIIPCKWDYKELEVKRCTEDAWKKAHEKGTTDASTSTEFPFTSTSALNQSTSAAPDSTTSKQNITTASSVVGPTNTTVSINTGTATTATSGTVEHSSNKNSSEHAGNSTNNSIFEDLQQSEIIFIGVCCLVIFLFCCIFCCCCAAN